jgi:urease accessory protein
MLVTGIAAPSVDGTAAPACAEITFARDPTTGRTYVRRQHISYPYHVCRALMFAGDPAGMATLYLQSCAGGIYRDDRLRERIVAEEGAAAHVTTQASTIVHSMDRGSARQDVLIEAAAGGIVEVLPDPFILFPQSRFASDVRIRAHESATVIVADSFICHDPAGGHAMFDRFQGDLRVEDLQGRLLMVDRVRVGGSMVAERRPGMTGGFATQGSLFVIQRQGAASALVEVLRNAVADMPQVYAGASALPNGCGAWLRVLAADGLALRAAMSAAWQAARQTLTGQTPAPRRK